MISCVQGIITEPIDDARFADARITNQEYFEYVSHRVCPKNVFSGFPYLFFFTNLTIPSRRKLGGLIGS